MGPELIILGSMIAFSAAGWLVLSRMTELERSSVPKPIRSLSIIIPARNEERNLPRLLSSIYAQARAPREIIVVNDHSNDRTAAVARDLGAVVIESPELPEGWQGKTWACWHGANASQSELLMFVDADTWLEPDALSRLLDNYRLGAMSICPYHVMPRFSERMSLFFNLNMAAATIPDGLFGQLLLIERENYFRVDGHRLVKGKVLENAYIASLLRKKGIPTTSRIGRGVLSFRMYPGGLRELIPGWTKGFVSGAATTPKVRLACLVGWISGLLSPFAMLLLVHDLWLSLLAYVVCAAQVGWYGRKIGSFGWRTAIIYPIPLFAFFAIFFRALLTPTRITAWKGRMVRGD